MQTDKNTEANKISGQYKLKQALACLKRGRAQKNGEQTDPTATKEELYANLTNRKDCAQDAGTL